jgi:hypothetical protein
MIKPPLLIASNFEGRNTLASKEKNTTRREDYPLLVASSKRREYDEQNTHGEKGSDPLLAASSKRDATRRGHFPLLVASSKTQTARRGVTPFSESSHRAKKTRREGE